MPRDVARATLYRGQINLWVEDELSREYLSALWNDPGVAFFIAGGNDGVRAVVQDTDPADFPNVFGVIDRDFRPTNRARWTAPGGTFRTFVLPVHEIENYLLDPTALAASRLNTLGQTGAQVEDHLRRAAGRLTWWAACREVIAELKRRFREEFVPDPGCGAVTDEAGALDHIVRSSWFARLAGECSRTTEPEIRQLLAQAHTAALAQLAADRWRSEFAGKEIFRDVGSRICDRTRLRGYHPTPAEFDIDLAKEVAAWQAANGRVPPDLADLLTALRQRIAVAP
jgi:hypothetical protein